MRKTALMGMFVIAVMASTYSKASAQSLAIINIDSPTQISVAEPNILAKVKVETDKVEAIPPPPPPAPVPVKYTVTENDTLSKIAESHGTTWKRLYDKNESIVNPDQIKVNEELTIPKADETLAERAVPVPVVTAPAATTPAAAATSAPAPRVARTSAPKPIAASNQPTGSTAGNTYTKGYCTWYVKNRRPGLPNNLGNANTWVSRAAAQGIATGSTPQVGAVGQQGMHVVYVESVNGNGTVTISEMNYAGLYTITTRTVPASSFQYIY